MQPDSAVRSNIYFGIHYSADPGLFHKTSSEGVAPTYHPILKAFRRTERKQKELRDQIQLAGTKRGLSDEESLSEWKLIVAIVTAKATGFFALELPEFQPGSVLPNTPKVTKALQDVAIDALCEMRKLVEKRTRKGACESWRTHPTLDLFPDGQGLTWVYVKMHKIHSLEEKGKKAYKVGKTTDLTARDSTHKTSNTDLLDIARFPEVGVVTEANIHKYLKPWRMENATEWFMLPPDIAALLESPSKLDTKIKEALLP